MKCKNTYFHFPEKRLIIRLHFETILDVVKTYNDYNVFGHLDYILRCGKSKAELFEVKDYYDVFYEILKTIIENGKGIEVNTAGLYKSLGFCHPHKDILKIYKETFE